MAIAGAPDSASPVSARAAISVDQFGANAAANVEAAAATSDAAITALRP